LHVCARHVSGNANGDVPECDDGCGLTHWLTGTKSSSNVARLLRNVGLDVKEYAEKELLAIFRRRVAASEFKPSKYQAHATASLYMNILDFFVHPDVPSLNVFSSVRKRLYLLQRCVAAVKTSIVRA
jgi:hypothetical protein